MLGCFTKGDGFSAAGSYSRDLPKKAKVSDSEPLACWERRVRLLIRNVGLYECSYEYTKTAQRKQHSAESRITVTALVKIIKFHNNYNNYTHTPMKQVPVSSDDVQ